MTEIKTLQMLPPSADKCQICAVEHDEKLPHNRDSLYYQWWFSATYHRPPTWADAALNCSDSMKVQLRDFLKSKNVPESVIGDL